MTEYSIERVWDGESSGYAVHDSKRASALATFDTKRQAQAFIDGIQYAEREASRMGWEHGA